MRTKVSGKNMKLLTQLFLTSGLGTHFNQQTQNVLNGLITWGAMAGGKRSRNLRGGRVKVNRSPGDSRVWRVRVPAGKLFLKKEHKRKRKKKQNF